MPDNLLEPARIIAAMERHGCKVERRPGCVNIVYVEGINEDGTLNDNRRDKWNDLRLVLMFDEAGKPFIAFKAAATTTPGYYYDVAHIIARDAQGRPGAALISLGQQSAWTFGYHHQDPDHPALVQHGGACTVYRDFDQSFRRQEGHATTGWYGINQHGTGGRDGNLSTIGAHSAGCLVVRVWAKHLEFIRLVRADKRFVADHGFVFPTTVMPNAWLTEEAVVTPPAPPAPSPAPSPIAPDRIVELARASSLATVNWDGRGRAPLGYVKGMAVAYATVYAMFKANHPTALAIAKVPVGNSDTDALRYYASNAGTSLDILRATFCLLIGLGMRESSGRYCEGRDRSAENTSADSAEAGLFQQSWDSHSASPELPKLLAVWTNNPGLEGLASVFSEGVACTARDLENSGAGDGAAFQRTCKAKPLFAVLSAAVGLRTIRRHWGPINRREAQMRPEATTLLRAIEGVVDSGAVTKPPVAPPLPVPGPPKPSPSGGKAVAGGVIAAGVAILASHHLGAHPYVIGALGAVFIGLLIFGLVTVYRRAR